MFQFGRFPSCNYFIHYKIHDSSPWGFPHSEIPGSMLIYSSPRLIAVSHVLLRLLMPRHSPCALFRLNFPMFSLAWVSQIIVFGFFAFEKAFFLLRATFFFYSRHFRDEIVVLNHFFGKTKSSFLKFVLLTQLSVRFFVFALFGFQWTFSFHKPSGLFGGLKWTRTTDLALIRRAL